MQIHSLKSSLKQMLPDSLVQQNRRLKRYLREQRDAQRSRAEVFTEIYEQNLWGGDKGSFYSGEGSSPENNERYCAYVSRFIKAHNIKKVIDIGCGDFQISGNIVESTFDYHGVDVVPSLIKRNERKFGRDHIRFSCRDVVRDELPQGDLVLIREVLQHLSNDEIAGILRKIEQYPYAIITEYQPSEDNLSEPNINKAHGMDTRIWENSGIFLERAPFNNAFAEVALELAVETPLVKSGERLVSYLLRHKQG